MNFLSRNAGRILLTSIMLICAAVASRQLWQFYMEEPWTRDGRICADVVHIAPDVSGLIQDVLAQDNKIVHKGDVIFRIDPQRFKLDLKQAAIKVEATKSKLKLTEQNYKRYNSLASNNAVSVQRKQEAENDLKQAKAAYDKAVAVMKMARLNLDRTTVKAPMDGIITNFSLRPGNYAQAGKAVAALIDKNSFYVAGYFEETKLPFIHPNAPVRIDVMGENKHLLGHVASISGGIQNSEHEGSSGLLANVKPTFSWVRLAQRIPVRIHIDEIPQGLRLIVGRTATVTILADKD